MKSFESFLVNQVRDKNIQKLAEFVVKNNIDVAEFEEWIICSTDRQINEGLTGGLGGVWNKAKGAVGNAWGGIKNAFKTAGDWSGWNDGSSTQDAAKAEKLKNKWAGSQYADKFANAGAAVPTVQQDGGGVNLTPPPDNAQKPRIAPGTQPGTQAASTDPLATATPAPAKPAAAAPQNPMQMPPLANIFKNYPYLKGNKDFPAIWKKVSDHFAQQHAKQNAADDADKSKPYRLAP